MTIVRSNKEVHTTDRPAARRHAPRPAKIQVEEPADVARARNTHYLQQARAYEIDTGDSPNILRAKRRWLQGERKAHGHLGKPVRELHNLYSKRNITKPKDERPKFDDLSDAAKELNRRLEDALAREPRSGAHADDGSAAVSDNAGEIPIARILPFDKSHTNSHFSSQKNKKVFKAREFCPQSRGNQNAKPRRDCRTYGAESSS